MKSIFLIFISFISISGFTQVYEFDTQTSYLKSVYNSNGNKKWQTLVYTNSKDDSYFLMFYNYYKEARIWDIKNSRTFRYKVTTNQNDSLNYTFIAEEKFNSTVKKKFSNYIYEFDTINTSNKKVKLNIYTNKKKKKPVVVVEFSYRDYESNVFPAFRINCLHPFEFVEKMNFSKNIVVTKATGTTMSGGTFTSELTDIMKINLKLIIPK